MAHEVAEGQPFDVNGRLKWFNYVKGYGFVTTDDGRDVFLHLSCLRKAGLSFVEDGSEIWCTAVDGERGLQATAVTQVRPALPGSGPQQAQTEIPGGEAQMGGSLDDQPVDAIPASVKWFNKVRGYGFLTAEGVSSDVFLHVEVLRRAGISTVMPGQQLSISVEESGKGLSARHVRLIDG
jgi:CspA family cold shock protein